MGFNCFIDWWLWLIAIRDQRLCRVLNILEVNSSILDKLVLLFMLVIILLWLAVELQILITFQECKEIWRKLYFLFCVHLCTILILLLQNCLGTRDVWQICQNCVNVTICCIITAFTLVVSCSYALDYH